LDAIGNGDKLFLHVSKKPKMESVKTLYNNFRDTAAALNVPFEIMHRRINISNPNLNWQHEQFSRKRRTLVAATLSSKQNPSQLYYGSSIFDRSVNRDTLARNIKFIAEALCRHIYGHKGKHIDTVEGSLGVNRKFVDAWVDFFGSQTRASGYTTKKAETEMERVLTQYTQEMKKTPFALESGFKFYKDASTQMTLYRVKPVSFDLFLALGIACWLGVVHLVVRAGSVSEWRQLLRFGKKDD